MDTLESDHPNETSSVSATATTTATTFAAASEHQENTARAVEDEAQRLHSEFNSVVEYVERRVSVGRAMICTIAAQQQQAEDSSDNISYSKEEESVTTDTALQPLFDSAEHTDINPDANLSPNPRTTSVAEKIRLQFARLRSDLDEREQELLQTVGDIRAAEKEMKQLFLKQYASNAVSSCQLFCNKTQASLLIKDDLQFISNANEMLDTAEHIRQRWKIDTENSLDHLTIEYTNDIAAEFSHLLSLMSVSSIDVVPHMSLCHPVESDIGEGVLTIVHIELRNYKGMPLLRIGEETFLSVQLSNIDTCVAATPTYSVYDNEDGTYRIMYSIPKRGYYTVSVCYHGHQLGRQPFHVAVLPQTTWTFGTKGTAAGEFQPPWSVAIGCYNNLYVSDCGNGRVQVFSPDGSYMHCIGSQGSDLSQLNSPRGICCSQSGLLYVADAGNNRIQVYSQDSGCHIAELRLVGDDPALVGPWGVVEGIDGNIYVSDMNAHSVRVMTPLGQFIRSIGSIGSGPGEFLYPRGLCCTPDGLLYVADLNNRRVQVFSIHDGSYVKELKDCLPMDVSIGVDNRIYISNFDNNSIEVLDTNGDLLETIGCHGSKLGQLQNPCGICCAKNGFLYVADAGNYRISVFRYCSSEEQFACSGNNTVSTCQHTDQPEASASSRVTE
jgi:DNA-binding beta-propeller fold protein YncE